MKQPLANHQWQQILDLLAAADISSAQAWSRYSLLTEGGIGSLHCWNLLRLHEEAIGLINRTPPARGTI